MGESIAVTPVRLRDLESLHARKVVGRPARPSIRELVLTVITAAIATPFFFVTFFVLPMMGQITVGFAAIITLAYLYYRRSLLVCLASLGGFGVVSCATFSTIQAIKYHLEIPLFIFLVLGVPVTFGYCVLVGSRIWLLRGGEE